MTPVYICFVLLLLAVLVNFGSRNKVAVYYVLAPAFAAMFLFLLFNDYGLDIDAYKKFYVEIQPEAFWERGIDLGYSAVIALVKGLGGEFYLFLSVINILSLYMVFKVFDKYSPYIALSWLMYFVLFLGYNHTILRQGVAIAFTLYSFRYIIDKNIKMYMVFIVAATLFHSSALLFLPAFWVANIKWRARTIFIVLALAFPLVFIDTSIIIAKLAGLAGLPESIVYGYFNAQSDHFERAGLSMGLLVRILFYLFFVISYNKEDRVQKVLFNLYSFYLLLYFPLSSVSMLSARGLDYYKIIECIMVPYAILNAKNIYYKIMIILVVLGYYIYATPKQYIGIDHKLDSALLWIVNSF